MKAPKDLNEIFELNEESLQDLVHTIQANQENFLLVLLHCDYKHLKKKIICRLQEICSLRLSKIELSLNVNSLDIAIEKELTEKKDTPSALMVCGLESFSPDQLRQLFQSANFRREDFPKKFNFPLLFWVNSNVLDEITRSASDFKSWATISEFAMSPDELIKFLRDTFDKILNGIVEDGSFRFRDNCTILGHCYCPELRSAQKDLEEYGVELEPYLKARLQFILGRDDYCAIINSDDKIDDQIGKINSALNCYKESFNFLEQGSDPKWQGILMFHIGLCYLSLSELECLQQQRYWEMAREFLQKSLDVFSGARYQDLWAKFVNQLEEVLERLERWDDLNKLAQKAESVHKDHQMWCELARDYGFLAQVALNRDKNLHETKRLAEIALDLQSNISGSQQRYRGLYFFIQAQAYQGLKNEKLAIKCLDKAIKCLDEARKENNHHFHPKLYIKILETLRNLYWNTNNYRKAFEIKQKRLPIEYEYGFRAFIGAEYLRSIQKKRAVFRPESRQKTIERIIREVIHNSDNNLVVIHGRSGVGKSSLIKAGLIPLLRNEYVDGRSVLPVIIESYSRNLISSLQKCLIDALNKRGFESEIIDSTSKGKKDKKLNFQALTEQLRQNSSSRNLLTIIIFDQFEEFFSSRSISTQNNFTEKHQFFSFLAECLELPDLKIILSLREDYLHCLLEFERFAKHRVTYHNALNNILDQKYRYSLENFSEEEAKSVIRNLMERSPFRLSDGLIDELVKDLANGEDEVRPIELQIVGTQLEEDDIRTTEKYKKTGSIESLIRRYLEEVVKDCGNNNKKIADWILNLLTDDKGRCALRTLTEIEQDLNQLVTYEIKWKEFSLTEKEIEQKVKNEKLRERLVLVLDIFVGSGLVFIVPEIPTERYRLVHDYLAQLILRDKKRIYDESAQKMKEVIKEKAITDVKFLNAISCSLFLGHNHLEALENGVTAARKLKKIEEPSLIVELQTVTNLRQAVYEVQEKNRFQGHNDSVHSVSFSPDGQILASASSDSTIILWDRNGKSLHTFSGHTTGVNSIAFSPNGKMLASGGYDRTVRLWDIEKKQEIYVFWKDNPAHRYQIRSLSFSPRANVLASSSDDRSIIFWKTDWDSRKWMKLKTLEVGWGEVTCINFSFDGGILASGSKDGNVRVWKIIERLWDIEVEFVYHFYAHPEGVNDVSFSPNERLLATTGYDGTLKLWDIDKQEALHFFPSHPAQLNSIDFSPDGKILAVSGADGAVIFWNLDTKKSRTFSCHSAAVNSVRFSPDGKTLASGSDDNSVKLWDVGDRKELYMLPRLNKEINSVSFNSNGKLLASGGYDCNVRIWDISKRKELYVFRGHKEGVNSVSFSPNGKMLASGSHDWTVKIWSIEGPIEEWRELYTFKNHGDQVRSVSFSPDGKMLASGSDDWTVKIWSVEGPIEEWRELFTFPGFPWWQTGHQKGVSSVSFSPDGKMLASGSYDHTIKLWDVQEWQELYTFRVHESVNSVSFSPDGKILACGNYDHTIKLWNVDKRRELRTFRGHNKEVNSVSFRPDGKIFASGSGDRTVRLWCIDEEKELTILRGHEDWIGSVGFSSDGKTLASGGSTGFGGQIILWDLDLDNLLNLAEGWLRDYRISKSAY